MTLLRLQNVTLDLGNGPLLREANATLQQGEHVCLLGRNGAGKSSLIRLLCQEHRTEHGEVIYQSGLKLGLMPQTFPALPNQSAWEVVAHGAPEHGQRLLDYHRALIQDDSTALERTQEALTHHHAWEHLSAIDKQIALWGIDGERSFETLSGGQKRVVLLARALVQDPDLLILDEPTNHLDLPTIIQLTQWMKRWPKALIFTTHDRQLIHQSASSIWELDRGQLRIWQCPYQQFLERRDALWENEQVQEHKADKKLAAEEVWLRQGVTARRKRNQGRLRALETLRAQRQTRTKRPDKASMKVNFEQSSSRCLIRAKNLSVNLGGISLFGPFDCDIWRGDKCAIIGPNGCGKSTLVRCLLKTMDPSQGTVKHAESLKVAYFDQMRDQLDDQATVQDNVTAGSTHVSIGGKNRHVIGYLGDFLFTPEQVRAPLHALSGGERNRLMLAKLFLQSANLLVLDEPTNDLDIETLELLEALLVDYPGAVLLVSHDLTFVENIATSCLFFDRPGNVEERIGGLGRIDFSGFTTRATTKPPSSTPKQKPTLSYQEKKELAGLPDQLCKLEEKINALAHTLNDPSFYQTQPSRIKTHQQELHQLNKQLEETYQRWEFLEEKSKT